MRWTRCIPRDECRLPGTLGYDIAYAKLFPQPDGTTLLRIVTDRPLLFGEVWASTRSQDYNLAGVEITYGKDKKKAKGTLSRRPS